MEIESGFGDPESKKRPCSMNRGVPSLEETNTKNMSTFFGDQMLCPPKWRCHLNRGVPKDRFHCIYIINSVNYVNGLFKVYTKHCSPFLFYL